MSGNNKTLNQKLNELDSEVEWFYSDEFSLDEAISKYEKAAKLAGEIEKDLKELKNKIEILKEKFNK